MSDHTPRVLIVADDTLVRAGLAAVLDRHPSCVVVGQVSADTGLPVHLTAYRPDVILWDLGWDPTQSHTPAGGPMLERLAEQADAGPPIVALLADPNQARETWAAGARALLPREAAGATIAAALVAASHGLVTIDSSVISAFFVPEPHATGTLLEPLTPREHQVLRLLAEGLPNKAIARQLTISEHTVKFHVNALLGKLGAQTRTEAVVLATRLGLLSL